MGITLVVYKRKTKYRAENILSDLHLRSSSQISIPIILNFSKPSRQVNNLLLHHILRDLNFQASCTRTRTNLLQVCKQHYFLECHFSSVCNRCGKEGHMSIICKRHLDSITSGRGLIFLQHHWKLVQKVQCLPLQLLKVQ